MNPVRALTFIAAPVVFSTWTAVCGRQLVARDAGSGRSDARGSVEAA